MAKKTDTKLADNETLNGSNTLPALVEIAEGKTVQLGEIVRGAFEASGMTVDEWNALEEGKRDELLNKQIAEATSSNAALPKVTVTRRIRHNGKRIEAGDYAAAEIRAFFEDHEESVFNKLVMSGSIRLPETEAL